MKELWTRKRNGVITITLVIILLVYGNIVLQHNWGTPAIEWMKIFEITDFKNFNDLLVYIKELRTGISPFLSISEIILWLTTGDSNLTIISIWFYRISIIFSYILAVLLFNKTIKRKLISFITSIVFITITSIVHPGNPQIYDVVFPFLILLYFYLIDKSIELSSTNQHQWSILLIAIASITLSCIELTRPYAIIFIPIAVISFYFLAKKYFGMMPKILATFLIPIIFIVGGWQMKLFLFNDGQVIWSNNSGFNLFRRWDIPYPPQLEQEEGPLKTGRWNNLNTTVHYQNSQKLSLAIITYILDHPLYSIKSTYNKILYYLSAPTDIYEHKPFSQILIIYPLFLLLTIINVFYQILFKIAPIFYKINIILINQENMMILFTLIIFMISVIGESGEEARFLISFLPLLATFPSASTE